MFPLKVSLMNEAYQKQLHTYHVNFVPNINYFISRAEDSPEPLSSPLRPRMAAGVGRGGDQGQQGQQGLQGQPGQQQVGGRDFHQPARDLEVNTSAKAQADKSTLKVCLHFPNCVSEADYSGVPAQWGLQRGQVWRRHRHQGDSSFLFRWTFCVQRFQPRINHELVKTSGLHWPRQRGQGE